MSPQKKESERKTRPDRQKNESQRGSDRRRIVIQAPPLSQRTDEEVRFRIPTPTDEGGGDDPCMPVPHRIERRLETMVCQPQPFVPPRWLDSLLRETDDSRTILTTLHAKLLEHELETTPALALAIVNDLAKDERAAEIVRSLLTPELLARLSERGGE